MGKIYDLLKAAAGEATLNSALGRWRKEISRLVDQIAAGEVGDVPTSRRVDTGFGLLGGGDLSADRTISVDARFNLSLQGGFGFLTQTDWSIRPLTGKDTGAGTSADPLQSMAEFVRRWQGRTFSPSVSSVTVTLGSGFASTDSLILPQVAFTAPTVLTVRGTMSQSDIGTITAFTAMDPATSTRATVTDAAQDFTPSLRRRIRVTDGPVAGARTWVCSTAAPTVANVGQFWSNSNFGGLSATPVAGNGYVIETFDTVLSRYLVSIVGPARVEIHDVQFNALPLVSDVSVSCFTQRIDSLKCKLFGCRFFMSGSAVHVLSGTATLMACATEWDSNTQAGFQYKDGQFRENACCFFSVSQVLEGASVVGQHNIHDGNGTLNVGRAIQNNGYQEDFAQRGFFGNVNGTTTQHVLVNDAAHWVLSATTARFWGAAGNTVTNALRVNNWSGFQYVTLPTATGVTPGLDVVLDGDGAQAWGTLPDVATAPNNAAALVRQ